MTSKVFTTGTVIDSEWLNDVNNVTYNRTAGVVSVKEYGAVGAGVTDDTAAVNATLVEAGYIYIPDGTYIVDPLSVASNTTIVMGPNAILKAKAGYGVNDRLLNIIGVDNVTIIGGTIQMGGAEYVGVANEQRHCVIVSDSTNVNLIRVTAIDSGGDGFYVGGSLPVTNVLLEDCVASNHYRNGLSITHGTNIRVVRGKYSNIPSNAEAPAGPWAGIDVEPNSGGFVTNVVIDGPEIHTTGGDGVLSSGPSASLITDLIVRNCYIHDVGGYGIKPSYTDGHIIVDNRIEDCVLSGIEDTTTTALYSVIRNNAIKTCGSYGIKGFVSNSDISGNTVDTTTNEGIYWSLGQFTTITCNRVKTTGRNGIYQERAYNGVVADNSVRDSQMHGIHVSGTVTSSITRSRKVTVSGNTVANASLLTNNTYSGIYLDTYANTSVVTGNTVVCGTTGNLPLHAIYAVDTTVYVANNQTDGGCKSGNSQVNVGGVAPASFYNSVSMLGNAYIRDKLLFSNFCHISAGTGTPEGAVGGPIGSLFLRTDGGASTTLYVKQSGVGNTGWVAK